MCPEKFQVFSKGEAGQMHVLVHRLTDEGRYELGHRFLGDWLQGRSGARSADVHMQWHMGVFELALGQWDAAHARLHEHILPAVERGCAATDAPAMLWRLRLDAPKAVNLPWEVVRRYAVDGLESESDDFVVLHHLLALSGAGDAESLGRWVDRKKGGTTNSAGITQLGEGLLAFATEDYGTAAEAFESSLGGLADVGGSDAQRVLFQRIADFAAAAA